MTGTLDTYDASDRALANSTDAIVRSVAYRLAPENRFPAAQDDADASYAWLLKNAASIGGDPKQVALASESAGGNLAIDSAIWACDQHLQAPVHGLLVYPVAGTDLTTPSCNETTKAVPLNRAAIERYVSHVINGAADLKDPGWMSSALPPRAALLPRRSCRPRSTRCVRKVKPWRRRCRPRAFRSRSRPSPASRTSSSAWAPWWGKPSGARTSQRRPAG